jgi:hypothetical protein
MPVTTRSQTRSPPTTRAQHSYSLRENRHPQGYYADMQGPEEDEDMAADALMSLSSWQHISPIASRESINALIAALAPSAPTTRRSARIASRA